MPRGSKNRSRPKGSTFDEDPFWDSWDRKPAKKGAFDTDSEEEETFRRLFPGDYSPSMANRPCNWLSTEPEPEPEPAPAILPPPLPKALPAPETKVWVTLERYVEKKMEYAQDYLALGRHWDAVRELRDIWWMDAFHDGSIPLKTRQIIEHKLDVLHARDRVIQQLMEFSKFMETFVG